MNMRMFAAMQVQHCFLACRQHVSNHFPAALGRKEAAQLLFQQNKGEICPTGLSFSRIRAHLSSHLFLLQVLGRHSFLLTQQILPFSPLSCAQSALGSISYLFGSNGFIIRAVFHDIPI